MSATYINTQICQASPMTLGEYIKLRGWKIPKNQNPESLGYLVEVADHNTQTWTAKEQFEANSIELDDAAGLAPYQQRVLAERTVLSTNLNKLVNYTRKTNFLVVPQSERELLLSQSRAMTAYRNKLDKRIDLFYPDDSNK
jgi:hypothetical protein